MIFNGCVYLEGYFSFISYTFLIYVLSSVSRGVFQTEDVQSIILALRESSPEEQLHYIEVFGASICHFFEKTLDNPSAADIIQWWDNHSLRPTPNYIKWPTIPLWIAYSKLDIIKKMRDLFYALDPYEEDVSEEELMWKLDKTENSNRMRRRLKRFYKATRHEGCVKRAEEEAQAVPER